MEHKAYEVINCPLMPINGVFHLQHDGSLFVHESGNFLLLAADSGKWEIWVLPITTRSIARCITISASHSPAGQSWVYFSTYNDRNDYILSSRMCLRDYNNKGERVTTSEQKASAPNPPRELATHASEDPSQRDQGVKSREEHTGMNKEPSRTSDATAGLQGERESGDSWLASQLLRKRFGATLVRDAEHKLVAQEGFVNAELFASLPAAEMTFAYLDRIGIMGKGLQLELMQLHRELQPTPASVIMVVHKISNLEMRINELATELQALKASYILEDDNMQDPVMVPDP
eukprot:gene16175-18462_t